MRSSRKTLLLGLISGFLIAGTACNVESHALMPELDGDDTMLGETGEAPPICPGCRPTVGGQTSDFGGVVNWCYGSYREVPASPELESAFDVAEIVAATSAPLEVAIAWGAGRYSRPEVAAETTLDATITLEPFTYVESSMPSPCFDNVYARATVALSTRDGMVIATAQGTLERRLDEIYWHLNATVDLSEVQGTLDIPIDPSRIHSGQLEIEITGTPDGVRGSVRATVLDFETEQAYQAWIGPTSRVHPAAAVVLSGWFPIDDCGADSWFPVDATEKHAAFGGKSPIEMFHAAEDAFGDPFEAEALWRDGSPTNVSVDLGEPPSGTLCIGAPNDYVTLQYKGSSSIVSSDGRIDTLISDLSISSIGTSGELKSVMLYELVPNMPSDDFADTAGIRGLDFTGRDTVGSELLIQKTFDDSDVSRIRLTVHDVNANEEIECLGWPAPIDADCRSLQGH